MTLTSPLLSVCIITFNHEEYISQTIESVLMQKCKFPIEVIIGDDCSTDRTGEICQEYSQKYPFVKVVSSARNVGMSRNFVRTSEACSGKYIATLEGDDYWTDPYKLQKQVDFLEMNPDFILCFHDRNCLQEGKLVPQFLYDFKEEKHFSGTDVFECNLHALTVVFRNIFKQHPYPKQFYDLPLYDFSLWAFLSLFGKSAYLNFVGATYRLHQNGVFTGNKAVKNYLKVIYCLRNTMSYFSDEYQKKFKSSILVLTYMVVEEFRAVKSAKQYPYLLRLFTDSVLYENYEYARHYFFWYKSTTKQLLKRSFLQLSGN